MKGIHDNPVSGNHHTLPSKVLGERRAHEQGRKRAQPPKLSSTESHIAKQKIKLIHMAKDTTH